jgi:hypothetical protein
MLVLALMLLSSYPLFADPVPVRFVECAMHGFLVLRTFAGDLVASGDLLQRSLGNGEVESRMVFRFEDGSMFDETVVYAQESVFALRTYRLVQRGPAFPEDTDVSLTGRYPSDCHVWVVTDDVPAFVRFDGPLFTPGPVWRIELTSPRWPDEPQ